jgi:hypothetical protein
MRFGRVLVRSGVTANDLFKGRNSIALAFLGFYIALLLLALNLPQMPALPIEWRFHGMRSYLDVAASDADGSLRYWLYSKLADSAIASNRSNFNLLVGIGRIYQR